MSPYFQIDIIDHRPFSRNVEDLRCLLKIFKEFIFLTEPHREPTVMHFLRGTVLLAALIAVPGAAVCWNLIPKHFCRNEEPAAQAGFDSPDSRRAKSSCCPIDDISPLDAGESEPTEPLTTFEENRAIKRMSGTTGEGRPGVIPSNFSDTQAVRAPQYVEPSPKTARQVGPASPVSRSFPSLESRLKRLGAKYYRLEKWGNRGELFRFSCYVSASGPNRYQKHFQAIGSDELNVMESVIMDIERWKNE